MNCVCCEGSMLNLIRWIRSGATRVITSIILFHLSTFLQFLSHSFACGTSVPLFRTQNTTTTKIRWIKMRQTCQKLRTSNKYSNLDLLSTATTITTKLFRKCTSFTVIIWFIQFLSHPRYVRTCVHVSAYFSTSFSQSIKKVDHKWMAWMMMSKNFMNGIFVVDLNAIQTKVLYLMVWSDCMKSDEMNHFLCILLRVTGWWLRWWLDLKTMPPHYKSGNGSKLVFLLLLFRQTQLFIFGIFKYCSLFLVFVAGCCHFKS